MDLFGEFEKRRGVPPPIAASKKDKGQEAAQDTWQVLVAAFACRLQRSYLIPVLPDYQLVFGAKAIWICPDEGKAQQKQADGQTAFMPDELMDIIRIAAEDRQKAAGIIAAKNSFGGTITR